MKTPFAGFTLIELLTVIIIISLLASLLLPVLSKAKTEGERIKCINNHKQLSLAWNLYALDHSSVLPKNGYIVGGGDPQRKMWVQGYYNHSNYLKDSTDVLLLTNPKYAQFAYYIPTIRIYKCPSDKLIWYLSSDKRIVKLRSYSMNGYIGWIDPIREDWEDSIKKKLFMNDHDFLKPSETFVFTDVHPESICWPFFGITFSRAFFMFPGNNHKINPLSFADGHVDNKKWLETETTHPENVSWHGHWHTTSPDNRDLKWLQEHSTE